LLLVDVFLQKRPVRWVLVDVAFFDFDPVLIQKTSGIATGRSRRLPVEDGLGHGLIVPSWASSFGDD
jgi:hypothetical protein